MKNFKSPTKSILLLFIAILSMLNAKVQAQCQAEFTYNANNNGVVYFYNSSITQDTITSYYWSFGNNQFSTLPYPVNTYANAGIYNVCLVITTANSNCTDTICQQITVPNSPCNLLADVINDSIAGTMTAVATLGALPYSYQWSNGSTQQTINPTSIGNYCVTVTDANGCTANSCYYWSGLSCNTGFTFTNGSQGLVNFNITGTNGQQFTFDFGDGTSPLITTSNNFVHTYSQIGNYQACLTMANCSPFCSIVNISFPLPCSGVSTNIVPVQNNTFLIAEVFNANYPITYQWTSGDTGQTIATNGVSTFCVTITDGLGCTATDCITVNPNCNLNLIISNDSLAGTMSATPTNGAGGYTYQWSNGETQAVIFPTQTDNYCVTVFDALGCSATSCNWWYSPTCNLLADIATDSIGGTMTAYGTNGTGPYSYLWSNGSTTATINPTITGSYCVTVFDATGCSATYCDYWYGTTCNFGFTQINQGAGQVLFSAYGNNGQNITWNFGDGSAIVINPSTQITHNFLNSGIYTVCMSVANCPDFCTNVTINLGNPCSSLAANITAYQNDTWLVVSATGGTWPFSYQWSTGDTAVGIATTMANTNYCVTVTDAVGCTVNDCITVNPGCTLNAFIVVDSIQGVMTANASSGIAPYSYLWTNGSTQQIITPTTIGNYCVTITDAMGCSSTYCVYWNGIYCNNGFTYTYQGPGEVMFVSYGNNGQNATWDFGDGSATQTSNATQLLHSYTNGGYYLVCMTLPGCNPVCMNIFVNIPGNSQICGNIFYDNNNNSVIDLGDNGIDSTYVYLWDGNNYTSTSSDAQGNYVFNNLNAGTYYLQFCTYNLPNAQGTAITVPLVDTANCASYTVTIGANDTVCGNNFGVYNNASEISGTVFIDANNNGVMDGSETGLSYQLVQIGNNYTYSDWYGNYSIWLTPGNYTVSFTPTGNYASGTVTTPSSYQINVNAPGNVFGNNNFGIYMPPGMSDLSIVITPHTTVTPGFPAWYDINICNYGSSATGAIVTMIYDAALTTNYQSPAGNVNSTNNTITWNIANINPNSCTNLWTSFNAQVGIQLGAGTLEFVSVTPTSGTDNYLSNNTDTVHQTIVGSWDPNNKIVVKTNNTPNPATHYISSVNSNQEIIYTVNFQNTGNAPAVNVVVIDEIASNLDLNSFQFLNASHNCDIIRVGNTVTYRFMNIMLPDSTNDEPNSHGFINFKINAINGLAIGTQIVDFANIYFDFNDPVLTNDAVITLIDVTGIENETSASLVFYPNPAKENFNLRFNSKVSGNANIIMYDNTGRKVLNTSSQVIAGENKTTINTNNLENGLYYIELLAPNGQIFKNVMSIQK